ncbi:putative bifunctional UDP-N-acetylglucosamine transferase and deubiquitinase ALG13 isoform X2 [Brienomyrus brachyistius]|uniref:putative bifunctional UDP-N-acetylglucosamine transferase and deubiquitinase ALG13 isoform X2 n=1 Tax=Brienomyrus brachyistius TaxID=42636 RepID=UPI0020B1834E|nr:putative bifunctional UDP-N-acetylglucosamine transferase and deubiquitinase ALG13 isoform X2 [Brienomyrus brachyistius]
MQKSLKKFFLNMDDYLASIGLYRKMMARDASCLFRAVSEQLYYSQNYHQKIRKDCVSFMRANRCNFEPFVEGSFEKYLERLEDPTETAGQVEIKALSLLYRRVFVIYRYPGKPPTEIADEEYPEKILLCCSSNGHYDTVYPRCYPVDAAFCQALLYQLLYCKVLGVDDCEVQAALDTFRSAGRRYRNSLSLCSEDAGYDTPDDRCQREDWELNGLCHSEDKVRLSAEESKVLEGAAKLSLPYKALKALDPEMYRNVEFDVWHDCRKEMQKTDYMVFAGRQYFLGDKCQVRLDPKGKFYNAFIQEVGTHASAVTVFIEELGEKHLVSLTNLKPVNPVPAWNVCAGRKGPFARSEQYPGELDSDMRGKRRFFKKPKGKEMLLAVSYSRSQPGLPPRLQPSPTGVPSGRAPPMHTHPPPPGLPYEQYRAHPGPRAPRGYGPPSSARFLNRHHLVAPEVAYYTNPGKRCYQTCDSYSYRSRSCGRSRRQAASKECQFSFVPESGEEPADVEGTITFYEIEEGDEAAFPPLPGQAVPSSIVPASTTFWVQRGHSPIPAAGKQTMTSSEEDPDERSNGGEQGEYPEDYMYTATDPGYQNPSVFAAAESTANLTIQEGGSRAGSPQEGVATYSYSQQVVVKSAVISSSPTVNTAPAAIFTSNSSSSLGSSQTPPGSLAPSSGLTQSTMLPPQSMGRPVFSVPYPPTPPWFVNEMGEAVGVPPPPPYSCDPNGSDLPQDCKVLQYYFNLGVQWYQQSYWHSMVQMQQVYQPPSADAPPFQPYSSVPQAYPEAGHAVPDPQGELSAYGAPLPLDPPPAAPGTVFYPMVQEHCGQPSPHSYESYVPVLPTSFHYITPWTPGPTQPPLHASFCASPSHPISYIATPAHPGPFIPPSM